MNNPRPSEPAVVDRGHRPDIDGLRAVAVLPVLFYHAHIWPFRSGYIGVDIFFVISGYLITGLILREATGRGFSIVAFYDRRIRRNSARPRRNAYRG